MATFNDVMEEHKSRMISIMAERKWQALEAHRIPTRILLPFMKISPTEDILPQKSRILLPRKLR